MNSSDSISVNWLQEFDAAMLHFFAIDHNDAGMDDMALMRYVDLLPREAALAFGRDYDLQRADLGWR